MPVQQQRKQLPIHRSRLELLHAVETHRAVVVCGPTGCGKSTQLPQYLDEAGWAADGYVIGVTLPRRVATVTVATRVAQEMNTELGLDVGYRIRFDSKVTPGRTRLEFMTDGILLREMLSDPLLTRYSILVIDEAHERNVNVDLLLGLLRKIMRKRPQLRLVVASATADVEAFLHFFRRRRQSAAPSAPALPVKKRLRSGWDDATGETQREREEEVDWRRLCGQVAAGSAREDASGEPEQDVCAVAIEGRLHPVQIHYLEEPACDYVESAVGVVMSIHERQSEGDVLVFLTGREEIEAVCALIKERLAEARERAPTPQKRPRPLQAVPLHGSLPRDAQLKAFAPGQRGARKVVVSTNLAEASVTIDGIVYVVDACMVKLDAFCPSNGVSYLNVVPCSRSSARQRAGRAGRTRPGRCYRLLTEEAFRSSLLLEHGVPELARADLKDAVLLLKCLGVDDVAAFEFMTRPRQEALELALEELYALGAVDAEARVTEPMGVRMAHGPLPLVLMRMLLLSAEPPHACAAEALGICAMATLQSPWAFAPQQRDRLHACRQSFAVHEGDLVTSLNVFRQFEVYHKRDREWAKRHLLNAQLLERAAQVRQQLSRYLERFALPIESCGHDVERLQRLACAALFLNAAKRLPNGAYRLCRPLDEARAPAARFLLHQTSVLASTQGTSPAAFVVCLEAVGVGEVPCLVHNTRIRPEWLPELAPHYFQQVLGGRAAEDRE